MSAPHGGPDPPTVYVVTSWNIYTPAGLLGTVETATADPDEAAHAFERSTAESDYDGWVTLLTAWRDGRLVRALEALTVWGTDGKRLIYTDRTPEDVEGDA